LGEERAMSDEQRATAQTLVGSSLIAHCSALECIIPTLIITNADGFVDA
jgi:hypothetical protein